jgi:hypothetical protein
VTRTFATPGSYTVGLRVTDNLGGTHSGAKAVTIGNRAPTAGFSWQPASPVAGETVTLTSSAADADGTIASHEWDLDGDGAFDDATGATVATTFPSGLHVVGLRATDDRGAAANATQTIDVAAGSAPRSEPEPARPGQTFDTSVPVGAEPPAFPVLPETPGVVPLRWLDPFPTVRIRGRTTKDGVKLSLFTVRAPTGSTVKIRCSGRSCAKKTMSARVKSKKATGSVRFRRLERSLRAGTVVRVYVAQRGLVGKYTRFKFRKLALPARTDRCLMPGSTRPVACPASP